ncbi:MAG: hypothetical protein ACE5HD_10940 [Acidobacteriota bacterium]
MRHPGLGPIYVGEYLKILEKTAQAMKHFPLAKMSPEERKAVVLSYVELVDRFQQQLKEAGITRLLDLYGEDGDRRTSLSDDEPEAD